MELKQQFEDAYRHHLVCKRNYSNQGNLINALKILHPNSEVNPQLLDEQARLTSELTESTFQFKSARRLYEEALQDKIRLDEGNKFSDLQTQILAKAVVAIEMDEIAKSKDNGERMRIHLVDTPVDFRLFTNAFNELVEQGYLLPVLAVTDMYRLNQDLIK